MTNIIYGKNPIREALAAQQQITKIFIIRGKKNPAEFKILQSARQQGIPIREVDKKKLMELVGHESHQGIVAIITELKYAEIEDIFQRAKEKKEMPLIALLDEIQDPHNFGAIIRSAEVFGFHGVIFPKDRSVGLTQTVAKTSAGAVAHLPVVRINNLARLMDDLKEKGVWIAGADQDGETALHDFKFDGSLAVVIGSEGKGLRRLVREKCDFLVKIPMTGNINSLNASVAAALLFYEARKQRYLK